MQLQKINTKNYFYLFLTFLMFFLFSEGIAQQKKFFGSDTSATTLELLKYDGLSAFGGLKKAYTQPLKWGKEDLFIVGTIAAGTAALYIYDEETSGFFKDQGEKIPRFLKDAGGYGSPENMAAFNTGVYIFGLISKNEEVRKTGVLLVSSATASGIILALGKTIIGRARPGTGEGKGSFNPFSTQHSYNSFPSGHSLFSFTTAYAIGKQFENPFAKAGLYSLGLIGPVTRLWEGAHWLTDVTLSIALSVAVVDSIDNYLNNKRNYSTSRHDKISWSFQVGLGQIGLTGTF